MLNTNHELLSKLHFYCRGLFYFFIAYCTRAEHFKYIQQHMMTVAILPLFFFFFLCFYLQVISIKINRMYLSFIFRMKKKKSCAQVNTKKEKEEKCCQKENKHEYRNEYSNPSEIPCSNVFINL